MRPRPRTSAWSKSWSSGPLRRSMRHLGPSVPHPYPGCQLSPGAAKLLKTGGKNAAGDQARHRAHTRRHGDRAADHRRPDRHLRAGDGKLLRLLHWRAVHRRPAHPGGVLRLHGRHHPFETLPQVAGKGGVLLAAKVAMGVVAALIVGHFLGTKPVETGLLAGLSTLAVVVAINDTNGGLYVALMGRYGTPQETGAYSIMSLESGPFITMMTLGGLLAFPWQTLLGAILPLAIGIALGNLDREMRDFLGKAAPALIPFFAFAIGASLNLANVWRAGLLGLALGLVVLVISCIVMVLADRISGGMGVAGLAAAATAGNAAAVPALVAAANPAYAAAAPAATVLVAASVVVTMLTVPIVTAWWARRITVSPAA